MSFSPGIVDALDPSRLRLLVEVGGRGSISAAAETCRIGQPSATKHLKTLEAAVGEKLVERNGRSSQLTEAGHVVAAHAARVLDTLQAMQEVSLGIAGEVDLPDGVVSEPFLDDELIGIAAPGELRLRRGRARPDELSGQVLLVRESGSSTRA